MKHVSIHFILIFLLLTLTLYSYAHVEKYTYLKGKVGQHELVLKMLCYDEIPTRQVYYFFDNDKKDHYLKGKAAEGVWEFQPESSNQTFSTKILLAITERRNGNWNGSFTDSTGIETDILLQPIHIDSIRSPFKNLAAVNEMNPYEQCRIANTQFIKTKTQLYNTFFAVEWLLDQQSGITFFKLQSRSKKQTMTMDSINETLTTTFLSMIVNFYQYRSTSFPTHTKSNITYLSREMLSYQTITTDTNQTEGIVFKKQFITLDLHSGQTVNLEDLIWFGNRETIPAASDLFKIYKYRNSMFAPKLYGLLQQLYPLKMQSDSCGIDKVTSWALPVWKLTGNGIAFDFRDTNYCGVSEWAIVPYKALRPFFLNKYRL